MKGKEREDILIKYVFGSKKGNKVILIKYMLCSHGSGDFKPNYFFIRLILKQSYDFKIIHFIKKLNMKTPKTP